MRVTPSRIVVSTQTTRGSFDHLVVEGAHGDRALVGLGDRGQHAPVLQRVVDRDDPVRRQLGQNRLEVGVVGHLVGVNEDEVVRALQLVEGAQRRPFDHADPALVPGRGDVAPGDRGVVGVHLQGDDGSPRRESRRHGDGRIAGEGADLEDPGGLGGVDQQLEEAAFLAADHHPPHLEVLPGRRVDRGEGAWGGRRVLVGVLLDLGIDHAKAW